MKTFEALQILKSAYCNGHIAAVDEAGKHINALIVVLDDISEEEDDIIELWCDQLLTSYIQRCITVFIKLSMKDRMHTHKTKPPFDNGSGLAVHPWT